MEIISLVLGEIATNCYIVRNEDTGALLFIDPADEPDRLIAQTEQCGGTPEAILLTHGHSDHIMAAADLKKKYGIPVICHADEKEMLADPEWNLTLPHCGFPYVIEPDITVRDQDVLSYAGFRIRVMHTPGHTAGSVCYYLKEQNTLFSGDTLFYRSYGRTDFRGGSDADMAGSLRRLLTELPPETAVCPGHGPATSIDLERKVHGLSRN